MVSWLSLKRWIKLWLFFLNSVLLGSAVFLDEQVGMWIFVAYIASGPLLLIMMWIQHGLTRLLGLAHLLPWVPLIFYLFTELAGLNDPLLFGYTLLVILTVGVCLLFDIVDVVRWFRGERYVMGSEEAYKAEASMRAMS